MSSPSHQPWWTYLGLVARCRLDVVHDINVNIVQNNVDAGIGRSLLIVDNVAENYPSFCGRNLEHQHESRS